VYDYIPKGDDARQVGNCSCNGRVQAAQADECLADYLELPLDRRSQHSVGEIIAKRLTGGESDDIVDRGLGIP
jgi:hypothetical protein